MSVGVFFGCAFFWLTEARLGRVGLCRPGSEIVGCEGGRKLFPISWRKSFTKLVRSSLATKSASLSSVGDNLLMQIGVVV